MGHDGCASWNRYAATHSCAVRAEQIAKQSRVGPGRAGLWATLGAGRAVSALCLINHSSHSRLCFAPPAGCGGSGWGGGGTWGLWPRPPYTMYLNSLDDMLYSAPVAKRSRGRGREEGVTTLLGLNCTRLTFMVLFRPGSPLCVWWGGLSPPPPSPPHPASQRHWSPI